MSGADFIGTWTQLTDGLGCAADQAQAIGAELLERHREPQRHYHSVEHIEAVLRHLDTLRAATPVTQLAAFFHDAIYDPTAGDNEEQSAMLAIDRLSSLDIEPAVVSDVAAIIRATAGHQLPESPCPGMREFLDADLAILGAEFDLYQAYANAIRLEYGHMSDDDFRRGREQVLVHFHERPVLYFTEAGQGLWDERARKNLQIELIQTREY